LRIKDHRRQPHLPLVAGWRLRSCADGNGGAFVHLPRDWLPAAFRISLTISVVRDLVIDQGDF
jgi:hypothetical protein